MTSRAASLTVTALLACLLAVLPASASAGPLPSGPKPEITGIAQAGQTLTVGPSTWFGDVPVTLSYQWDRCDRAGTACDPIPGATSVTYVASALDVAHALVVEVTATDTTGPTTISTPASAPVGVPANSTLPLITGTLMDTRTLHASPGTWAGTDPMTFTYQWQRCTLSGNTCDPITGAVADSYRLDTADVDGTIRVEVTAHNPVSDDVTALSVASGAVLDNPPANTTAPVISGTARSGETLTASTGTWTGTPTLTYSFAWQRCDPDGDICEGRSNIGASYVLSDEDIGHTIRVTVAANNNAPGQTEVTSEPSGLVVAAAPTGKTAPVIAGTARDRQSLIASEGVWNGTRPMSFKYQWQRSTATGYEDILGATRGLYDLLSADVGHKLRVLVTATNDAGNDVQLSPPSANVAALAPAAESQPRIDGSARAGELLVATPGTWSGTLPMSYRYQWERCLGVNCDPIPGAVDNAYTLSLTDVGYIVRVIVTAINQGGQDTASSLGTSQVTGLTPVPPVDPPVTPPTNPPVNPPNKPPVTPTPPTSCRAVYGLKGAKTKLGRDTITVSASAPDTLRSTSKLTFIVKGRNGVVRKLSATLDGRKVKTAASKLTVTAGPLSYGKHAVRLKLQGRSSTRTIAISFRIAACA